MAEPRPFLLVVDGRLTPCSEGASVVYPPTEEGYTIEAHLTKTGVQVNVVDDEGDLVDTVHVHRGDGPPHSEGVPKTNEEAVEDMHAALVACLEFGVPLFELSSYMLSRAAELAYAAGTPRTKFVQTCVEVYENSIVGGIGTKTPVGEA